MNKLTNLAAAQSGVCAFLLWDDIGFRSAVFSCDGLDIDTAVAHLLAYVNENY
jgi:hypothetical protein